MAGARDTERLNVDVVEAQQSSQQLAIWRGSEDLTVHPFVLLDQFVRNRIDINNTLGSIVVPARDDRRNISSNGSK